MESSDNSDQDIISNQEEVSVDLGSICEEISSRGSWIQKEEGPAYVEDGSKHVSPSQEKCRKPRNIDSFATYIHRVLGDRHEGLAISKDSVELVDKFLHAVMENLMKYAISLADKSDQVVTDREIEYAVAAVFPGELAQHAIIEARKAVDRFNITK